MSARPVVLLVDDEDRLRRALELEVAAMGYEVETAARGDHGLAVLDRREVAVVLLDLRMPGPSGLEVLRAIKQRSPLTEVIILTGHGTIPSAIEAMRAGAYDVQEKPCRLDKLEALIGKALERRRLALRAEALAGPSPPTPLDWGRSEAMARVRADLERAAPSGASILILGESGTGKELVAREVHRLSPLAARPFVAVNCGAVPSHLAESLLFGYERGAFTGAVTRRLGLLEVADGGTLLLDELGELPWECQTKLLRFLQAGEVLRVGATEPVRVRTRVLAATNVDIDAAVAAGAFREDLLHRLDTIRLVLPPLRERVEDLAPLVESFLRELAPEGTRRLDEGALAALEAHPWSGNAREVRKVIERLLILVEGEVITAADVRRRVTQPGTTGAALAASPDAALSLKAAEGAAVARALRLHPDDKRAAAAELGVSLRTLYNKIRTHGL